MKFGMNLLLWTGEVQDQHLPVLEMLKKMGYDGVELPIFNPVPEHFAKLGKQLDNLGLERTAVTIRTEADNPISGDAHVRAKAVEGNKRVLEGCQAAGVQVLCGRTDEEWMHGVETMRTTAEYAQHCNVKLGVEYLNRFECYFLNSAADTVKFVEEVDHPFCRMMYDTFHANIEEKNIPDAIRTCAKYTVHVHISENDRSTPGTGHVHWKESFDTLRETGYDGWMMVEAFGLALPELAAATKIWRRMYQNEEQLSKDSLHFMKSEWAKRS